MKVAIIGVGNMGGALARSFARRTDCEVIVSNRTRSKIDTLRSEYSGVVAALDNASAVESADVVVFAVKPWLITDVIRAVADKLQGKIVVSVAAGIDIAHLRDAIGMDAAGDASSRNVSLFRLIPNTAVALDESMNIIAAAHDATAEAHEVLISLLKGSGRTLVMSEEKLAAATSVASCGIAYVLKYIQAATQAGTELGLSVEEARIMAAQSALGAASLLLNSSDGMAHPMEEIDRVTTPGGLTIRGINSLEESGFAASVIAAIKSSTQ